MNNFNINRLTTYLLILITFIFIEKSFSQCGVPMDLRNWSVIGTDSKWTVRPDGKSVYQSVNGSPTYFISDFDLINVKFKGEFTVGPGSINDDDFVGFVFGYRSPFSGVDPKDYYLYSTIRSPQTNNSSSSIPRCKNFVGHVKGTGGNLWDYMPATIFDEYICSNSGGFPGWKVNTTHQFECIFTSSHIKITVDGVVIVDIEGCFHNGRFGFYNYSQEDVTYSNFEYETIADFSYKDSVCVGSENKYQIFCDENLPSPYTKTKWYMGDGTVYENINIANHIYKHPGNYDIKLEVEDANGCSDQITKTVSVINPEFNLGPDLEFCINETDSVLVSADQQLPSTFIWNTGETTKDIVIKHSGEYRVKATNDIGCEYRDTIQITFNQNPTADFTFTNVCNNEEINLIDNSNANSSQLTKYFWDLESDDILDYMAEEIHHTYPSEGKYEVTYVVENSLNCKDTIKKEVIIYAIPEADFAASSVCIGDITNFSNNSKVKNIDNDQIVNHLWDFDNGTSSTNKTPKVTFANENIYKVRLHVATNYGCKDSVLIPIMVYPKPIASFTVEDACFGYENKFKSLSTVSNINTHNSIDNWNWNFGDGNLSNEENPSHLYAVDGMYIVHLETVTNHGCISDTTINTQVFPLPKVDFIGETNLEGCSPICPGMVSTSTIGQSNQITSYKWIVENQLPYESELSFYQLCLENHTGFEDELDVKLIATTNNGCVDSLTKTDYIKVFHNPKAEFFQSPEDINVLNPEVNLINTSINADYYEWWSMGDTINEVDLFQVYPYTEGGVYKVALLAYTHNNCVDTFYQDITVLDQLIFYIPNSFTPDNSGINDDYRAIFTSGVRVDKYRMEIYNRWGELIWETTDISEGWNGKYKDKDAPYDTYIWKIEFRESMSEKMHHKSGTVNLLR